MCIHALKDRIRPPVPYIYERLSSLSVFSVPVSLWNPRDGCAAVGLVAGQGGPICMYPSWSLGAVPIAMDS